LTVRTKLLALLVIGLTVLAACAREPKDQGNVSSFPVDTPKLKQVRGAEVWFMRRPSGEVIALWGMSPLGSGGKYQCFIEDRTDRPFGEETRPFVDPCNSAWWSRDGHFLGYTRGDADTSAAAPDLIRIPVDVRDGRVVLNIARLDCLQRRQTNC